MGSPDSDPTPVYLVFGATGGIGSSLSRRLAGRGARLVVAARDSDRLRTLAAEIGAEPIPVDATRFDEANVCVDATVERFGRLDGVANCVGSLLLKPAHSTTEAEWMATVATNLTSAFAVLGAAAKAMTATGGSIVLVSSAAARVGLVNHEAIAAAKAGVIGLTLSAAATYATRGIRVNCVAPGLIRTPMTARLTANEASLKASTAMHALGRVGDPADAAGAIDWLLGPDSGWVTGQVLGIDGGLATVRPR
ncbi:MAG: SDR family oxidoreductase [Planctomycetes bacterium]|nr:SDR family oxidoreductase [Planctomycetota bacterium]